MKPWIFKTTDGWGVRDGWNVLLPLEPLPGCRGDVLSVFAPSWPAALKIVNDWWARRSPNDFRFIDINEHGVVSAR